MAAMQANNSEEVKSNLTNFLRSICSRLTADGVETSTSKCVVKASETALGESIVANMSQFGIKYV